MTRFSNLNYVFLDIIKRQKLFSKKKNMRQNRFMKLSKFQKFQLSTFNLTWSNEGKMNDLLPDMTYSKKLLRKMKTQDKLSKHSKL